MSEITMQCPACGAKQDFPADANDLTCAFCGFHFTWAGVPVEPPTAALPDDLPRDLPPAAQAVISSEPEGETPVVESQPYTMPPMPEEPKKQGWVKWVVIAVVAVCLVCLCVIVVAVSLFAVRSGNTIAY